MLMALIMHLLLGAADLNTIPVGSPPSGLSKLFVVLVEEQSPQLRRFAVRFGTVAKAD
jgi:hypothetical protein